MQAVEETMSDLDSVRELITEGNKENAIALLASMLLKDKNNADAWLLLGELIDDPSRKKECYHWALKLSPYNRQAMLRLQELEERKPVPVELPVTGPQDGAAETSPQIDTIETRRPAGASRQSVNFVPNQNYYSPVGHSKSWMEIVAYVVGGIAVFLVLLYVITKPDSFSEDINNPANNSSNLYVALIFISLIAVIIILTVADRNRR